MVEKSIQLSPMNNLAELIKHATADIQELYLQDSIPWIVGVSWGKDSSCVLQLVWKAIAALPQEKRTKTVHVISTDTQIEDPIFATWVHKSTQTLKAGIKKYQMPFKVHLLKPEIKDSFWVCLLGHGYAAPRHKFRWCTPRLKIAPSDRFIKEIVSRYGESIMVLGVRRDESSTRKANIDKHAEKAIRENLTPSSSLPNSLIYTPIVDWTTNDVWMYLLQVPNPWGGDNQELFTLYRGATADTECPMVMDTSNTCAGSRFGCWTCTMVTENKSLTARVENDEQYQWLEPLLEYRNLLAVKNDRDRREFCFKGNKVKLYELSISATTTVEAAPGKYTKQWRELLLKKLLETQVKIQQQAPAEYQDLQLISTAELSEIRSIWLQEKHELDDRLPQIYHQVIGQPFFDPRPTNRKELVDGDIYEILAEICAQDSVHLQLVSGLLNIEQQFQTKVTRKGIFQALEKYIEANSQTKDELLVAAYKRQQAQTAALEGNTVQLSLLFNSSNFQDQIKF